VQVQQCVESVSQHGNQPERGNFMYTLYHIECRAQKDGKRIQTAKSRQYTCLKKCANFGNLYRSFHQASTNLDKFWVKRYASCH